MRIILLTIILLSNTLVYSQFAGGSGTSEDPYQVATAEHLNNIRYNLTSHYIQTADIDLGVTPWNEGEGWEPIGDYYWTNPAISFSGDYDGNNFEISNLTINRPDRSYCGLFGASLNSTFQNIHLIDVNIIGSSSVGGLVGLQNSDNISESISNCSVTGYAEGVGKVALMFGSTVYAEIVDCHVVGEVVSRYEGNNFTGGLIASALGGSMIDSYSIVTITSLGNIVGGLIGDGTSIRLIKNCYSKVNIKNALKYVGGLIGGVWSGSTGDLIIENTYVIGELFSTQEQSGGFIGVTGDPGGIEYFLNCYANVNLTGYNYVGGFIGKTYDKISLINCYSRGSVTGNSNVGGFSGYLDSPSTTVIENCYWDTEASGLLTSDGGEGRTTAEMTLPYTGNTYIGWDFGSVWADDIFNLNDGYPMLQWACGIEEDEDYMIPESAVLYQNYPNPFNPVTQIRFDLANTIKVKLSVYNVNGQKLVELTNGVMNAGSHSVEFDGSKFNSGVYYYTLEVEGRTYAKKMIILK